MVWHQVGHAPRVAINFYLPVEPVQGGRTRVQRTVLRVGCAAAVQAGLTGVGGAVFQRLRAVAAVGL